MPIHICHDHSLQNVNEVRYLGVITDSKLNKQIDSACKKANGTSAFLKKNLYSCKHEIKSDAYVHPVLEYAVCSWAPKMKCKIDKLESIQ